MQATRKPAFIFSNSLPSLAKSLPGVLGLAALGLIAPAAHAQTAYVNSLGGDVSSFGTLNLQTGVFTAINSNFGTVYALGFGANGALYGLAPDSGAGTNLFQISTETGTETLLHDFTDVAVYGGSGNADGTFTAISDPTFASNNRSSLFTVDPVAQTLTLGVMTFAAADGLAVSDSSGNVFVSDTGVTDTGADGLDVINTHAKHPGTAFLGDTGLNDLYTGLFSGGQLYTFGYDPNSLDEAEGIYTLNTDTGAATFVAATSDNQTIYAAALAPASPAAVPEASTTISFGLLLAFGGLAVAAKRRKASRLA